jgi:hypothetical protein
MANLSGIPTKRAVVPIGEQPTKLEAFLLTKETPTFAAYYNGKMSYALHGKKWRKYVEKAFPDLAGMTTSENLFKSVIDLYAENLVPLPEKLRGFSNCVVPLLSRGECVVVVDSARTPHFPEHYEMMSDGKFTIAVIYTRSLQNLEDYITFAYSDGRTRMFKKPVPDDFAAAEKTGFTFVEETTNNTLFRFALDDKGFGATVAALQDRVNHSIIDQTVVAEMYARPFWYLLNTELPAKNPYLPGVPDAKAVEEQDSLGEAARLFTTSSAGPFGQLNPPTISDMITYHDSITDKASQSTGIPQFYFKPGSGAPPTGVALKVLSKRFNNKIARMREDIEPQLTELADLLGVERTLEVKDEAKARAAREQQAEFDGNELQTPPTTPEDVTMEYEFWNTSDDLLQESLDAHGISLSQMGYPLEYIASVVTPGVDLDDYMDDGEMAGASPIPGQPTDMTAPGQTGLPATPGQVASYAQNPGQRAKGPVS